MTGITSEYYGETGKSIQKRSQGHYEKLRSWDPSNFMLRHNVIHHPEEDPLNKDYLWTPLSHHEKPLERVVEEAIRIKVAFQTEDLKDDYISMNGKGEYTRNVLPGISRKASPLDKESNESITKKILDLKKQSERQKPNPRKKQKLQEDPETQTDLGTGDRLEHFGASTGILEDIKVDQDPTSITSAEHTEPATNPTTKGYLVAPLR